MRLMQQVHGVAVSLAIDEDGPLFGVLIVGKSGAGKSRLAVAAVHQCPYRRTRLVADDRVNLSVENGSWYAAPPEALKGRIEVRGVGVVACPSLARTALDLVIDLDAPVDRIPDHQTYTPSDFESRANLSPSQLLPLLPFDGADPLASTTLVIAARRFLVDKSR